MNITFVGWRGDILRHEHRVTPLYSAMDVPGGSSAEAVTWSRRLTASGKIDGVSLNGDYLMTIHLEPQELRNSIEAYIQSDPRAAAELLAQMATAATAAATDASSPIVAASPSPETGGLPLS